MTSAAGRARQRNAEQRRAKERVKLWAVDANGEALEVGGQCGLTIDLGLDTPAPRTGDWIATDAGSRYLIDHDGSKLVRSAKHSQVKRYRLRVLRLPKHAEPPAGVRVITLAWYPRGKARG